MIAFPNCKINLGLNILRKRDDGFHDIETVFYPLKLSDALEVIQLNNSGSIEFSQSGMHVDGSPEDNICCKAWHLLKKDLPQLPPIKMHLHKSVPLGAGLGGGSADGAFALKLLNEKFNLGISTTALIEYAETLGSDVPFFIVNKPCFATGRGEVLEEIKLDLSAYTIVLVNPGIHVNTGWAFSQLNPSLPPKNIRNIISQSVSSWKDELKNDFEGPVFEKYPAIKNIKEELYNKGALYAAMSGSGSTVFGIFDKEIILSSFGDPNYFVRVLS